MGRACRRLRKRCGFHFTPHDLRRTAASGMAALGTPRDTLSKILNHKSADGSVTAIYDRYDREAEMRRALFAWGSKLEAILDQKSPKVFRIG
ncbi:MAG: tyrosine-type recombinase/integrase [Acidobacteriota bacterium]